MAVPVILLPAIKFLGPIIPFIKIAAIGLIKLVFLFVGSLVAPVYTFMLLNKMTVPTVAKIIKHMRSREKLTKEEADQAVEVLDKMLASAKRKELSRSEARAILLSMQKEIIIGIQLAFGSALRWVRTAPGRIRNWNVKRTWRNVKARTQDIASGRGLKTDKSMPEQPDAQPTKSNKPIPEQSETHRDSE